ncbi:SNARE associated Golgi protein [Acididesulfobacillus acetoxydans]|uniref:TVP38/TMEM64 family membrane protein n=1 Tax=Acididesulfobacillus acetoxydans TaxID=1561005 RepID=A0A8S0X1L6_9FIRM|nr:VTT domain-containing protein [Acididesulfobacillus acetoxydans]CAA7603221.1 SNARE associated Golgi protein [Acididesulfobacillus acetoxydans]
MNQEALSKTLSRLDQLENQLSVPLLAIGILLIAAFLYLDRCQAVSDIIRSTGWLGVVTAVTLITVLSMTPIPTESLTIMCFKSYGIGWGIFYSWLGSTLSALLIFALIRGIGEPLFLKANSHQKFRQVDAWVSRKGTAGLLIARLLPLPAFLVNYITALLPAVRFWDYLWTAAVTIIPSYLMTAMVFAGVATKFRIWLWAGILGMILIWLSSYLLHRLQAV